MKKNFLYIIILLFINLTLLKCYPMVKLPSKKQTQWYSTKYDPSRKRLEIFTKNHYPKVFYNIHHIDFEPALNNFVVFHTEEKDFIKKYISDSLGSWLLITKFFNAELGEVIKEVSNLKKYLFNEDESRLFIITTKKNFFARNDNSNGQLIDTSNGKVLLSLNNIANAKFESRADLYKEKLVISFTNDNDEMIFYSDTGELMGSTKSDEIEKLRKDELTLWDRMKLMTQNINRKNLSVFFKDFKSKQQKKLSMPLKEPYQEKSKSVEQPKESSANNNEAVRLKELISKE